MGVNLTTSHPVGSDLFDQLYELFRPERLLDDPRATGAGVRVAIVDTGVERSTLEQRAVELGRPQPRISGAVFRPDSPDPLPWDGHQSTPHGTIVADILLNIAPEIELFSADVFGPGGSRQDANCEVETVIRAMRHAIEVWDCKIINLSLGVPEHRLQQIPRRYQFLRAIEEGYFRDVLIFAAAHNEHPITRSYPAAFATPLISVDRAVYANPLEFAYFLCDHIEFRAHAQGYLGPFTREPTTSWATPHLAGIAARILSLRPNLKPFEIKTILYWMSQAIANKKA